MLLAHRCGDCIKNPIILFQFIFKKTRSTNEKWEWKSSREYAQWKWLKRIDRMVGKKGGGGGWERERERERDKERDTYGQKKRASERASEREREETEGERERERGGGEERQREGERYGEHCKTQPNSYRSLIMRIKSSNLLPNSGHFVIGHPSTAFARP